MVPLDPGAVQYFDSLLARGDKAGSIPFRTVRFADGSAPLPNKCHTNATDWCAENSDCRRIRGWIVTPLGVQSLFTGHSVVASDVDLFDITPDVVGGDFLVHVGSDCEFDRIAELRPNIVWPPIAAPIDPGPLDLDPSGSDPS